MSLPALMSTTRVGNCVWAKTMACTNERQTETAIIDFFKKSSLQRFASTRPFGVRRQSESGTALWIGFVPFNFGYATDPQRCRASLATALYKILRLQNPLLL